MVLTKRKADYGDEIGVIYIYIYILCICGPVDLKKGQPLRLYFIIEHNIMDEKRLSCHVLIMSSPLNRFITHFKCTELAFAQFSVCEHRRHMFGCRVCSLIVIAAVSLAAFVASLMVFLLESALHEGVSLH